MIQWTRPMLPYAALWEDIYGPGAWAANPWVIATTFTVHKVNIDGMKEIG